MSKKLLLSLSVVTVLALTAPQAYAAFNYQPDAALSRGTKDVGGNVYDQDGAGQVLKARIKPGKKAIFQLSVGNDGDGPDTFLVSGCGNTKHFRMKYRHNDTNITMGVTGFGQGVGPVAPAADELVDVIFKASKKAKKGERKTCLLEQVSGSMPGLTDGAIAKVKVAG